MARSRRKRRGSAGEWRIGTRLLRSRERGRAHLRPRRGSTWAKLAGAAGGALGGVAGGGFGGISPFLLGGAAGYAGGAAALGLIVSTTKSWERDTNGSQVQIDGRVELRFKTDYVPLEP
jgi:hypothetical protein